MEHFGVDPKLVQHDAATTNQHQPTTRNSQVWVTNYSVLQYNFMHLMDLLWFVPSFFFC